MDLATGGLLLLLCFGIQDAFSAEEKCIRTQYDLQQSLVSRTVNMETLNAAFSPTNRQESISFYVYYHFCSLNPVNSSLPSCSTLENWVHDMHSGENGTFDFSKHDVQKFLWNASPVNLFIRPDLLQILSLNIFRIYLPEAHLILDPVCDDVKNPFIVAPAGLNESEPLDKCRDPPPILVILETLTANLKSFHIHKQSFFTHGIGNTWLGEQGYPSYYFDPWNHVDDVCPLRQVEKYMAMRLTLAAAEILTQLLIPFAIPFVGRLVYVNEYGRKKMKSYVLQGSVITIAIVLVLAFIGNLYIFGNATSSVTDTQSYYSIGPTFIFGIDPFLLILNLYWNLTRLSTSQLHTGWCDCLKANSIFVLTISIVALTLNLLSFNIVYILMGVFAAPLATSSMLCLITLAVSLLFIFWVFIFKNICNHEQDTKVNDYAKEQKESNTKRNTKMGDIFMTVGIMVATLVTIFLYCGFYYRIAVSVGPYKSSVTLVSFIVAFVPAMFPAMFPFMSCRRKVYVEK